MRFGLSGVFLAILALVVLVVGYASLFEVHQTRQALVVQLGQPVERNTEPGLHVKWPFIESVIFFDKRILDLENPAQEMIASDSRRLFVDAFARYRIADPLKFYQTVGSVANANSQLSTLLNAALRRVLGAATLIEVVKEKRAELMEGIRRQLNGEAKTYGIEVVDVRIRRADLPKSVSEAVDARMQTERQRIATQLRAEGNQKAQEIRAEGDRRVTVLLAEATSKGERIRGEGDAKRNQIFAEAYGRDPDFFAFYRSMQAYEASLQPKETRMLLSPDSDFFRYFGDPSGKPRDSAPSRPGTPSPGGAAASSTQR
jgi:modulator of FtsH protease HflC